MDRRVQVLFTLSKETVAELESIPKGERSRFVERALRRELGSKESTGKSSSRSAGKPIGKTESSSGLGESERRAKGRG